MNDHVGVTELILQKATEAGLSHVYPVGAVSIGSKGERLTEIGELHSSGCVAISDDGHPVADALMMRRALEYASMFNMPVINHCEDPALKADGSAHEGYYASALGLRGIPGAAEAVMVERDVTLSELTGGRVHIAHMSVRGSLRAVRSGKERDIAVTCEVTPHHLVLTDEQLSYDTNFKMNPPATGRCRSRRDARGTGRRVDRRYCDRPRAPPCGREGCGVRQSAVRNRGSGDGRAAGNRPLVALWCGVRCHESSS